jgi:16S rRNA processing protein RimM
MKVGKIRDAHGMKGEVFVISFAKDLAWLESLTHLKLEGSLPNKTGKHEPATFEFAINEFKPHKKGALIRLEGVADRTAAEKLIGFCVELDLGQLKSESGEKIFLHEVEGFEVYNGGSLRGVVTGFSSNGAQDLAMIRSEKAEFSAPFIPEFIEEIKWKEKQIVMTYPLDLEEIDEA